MDTSSSSTSSGKRVLDEDAYVEQLEHIIERDFFPALPALRKQHALLDGESDSVDTRLRFTKATLHGTHSTRADGAVSDGDSSSALVATRGALEPSSWDQPTPTRHDELSTSQQSAVAATTESDGHLADGSTNHVSDDAVADMTLSRFVATHTSEDNESFNALQEKTVEEHQKRYHWAFDVDEARGDPRLHLLSDGSWITKEQRRIVDQVCAPKGPIDTRPSAPDSWKFRARNPLLFPPELKVTRDICQLPPTSAATDPLLLENGGGGSRTSGRPPRAKRTTIYANSRFPSAAADNNETAANAVSVATSEGYTLVQMTPLVVPGVDASPLMTWGDIEGTPLALDARATPERILNTPVFEVKETPVREKLASRLEAQARLRKSTTSSRRASGLSLLSTGRKRSLADEAPTPGPRSVRERLSSIRSAAAASTLRTPFGADIELRASYATPLRPPPRHRHRHTQSSTTSATAQSASSAKTQ